ELWAVEPWDLGEHADPAGRAWRRGVDLDPTAAETRAFGEPGAREEPRRRCGVAHDPRALALPAVVASVLRTYETGFGTSQVPPALDPCERVPSSRHVPEEVVRGEEHQVAAAIAVALDRVVLANGDVLVVAWEHDEVVGPGQPVAAGSVEIAVGKEV